MRTHSAAGLVGPIVQAGAALVLVLVFLLVLRFTPRHRFGVIWLGAWMAHFLGSLPVALVSASMLLRISLRSPALAHDLGLLLGPGQYASITLVVIGAFEATGRSLSAAGLGKLVAVAVAAGLVVALGGYPAWALQLQSIATPILLFGAVQILVRAARGPRSRGLLCLAGAMVVYATVASAYVVSGFIAASSGALAELANQVTRYSGFADAVAVVVLGGAVIILIIQDGFLEAVRSRGAQLEAVASAERAAALSRVVSEVVRGLGQPINSVLSKSNSLLDMPGTGVATQGLTEIRQQAMRASHLVEDLAAYARTLGRPEEFVDLADVARTAVRGVGGKALRRDIALASELPDAMAPVRADRALVDQILRGLLDNALAAAGRGGRVHLFARLHARSAELVVEDSGPGVEEQLYPQLFERGFTTKLGGKESILGLSLFAQVARSYGGTLRCDNRPMPGIGARFVLTIPLASVHKTHD